MNHTAAQIERLRALVRAALHAGDMPRVWSLIRIVVGIRICTGEITLKLKPAKTFKL